MFTMWIQYTLKFQFSGGGGFLDVWFVNNIKYHTLKRIKSTYTHLFFDSYLVRHAYYPLFNMKSPDWTNPPRFGDLVPTGNIQAIWIYLYLYFNPNW